MFLVARDNRRLKTLLRVPFRPGNIVYVLVAFVETEKGIDK